MLRTQREFQYQKARWVNEAPTVIFKLFARLWKNYNLLNMVIDGAAFFWSFFASNKEPTENETIGDFHHILTSSDMAIIMVPHV